MCICRLKLLNLPHIHCEFAHASQVIKQNSFYNKFKFDSQFGICHRVLLTYLDKMDSICPNLSQFFSIVSSTPLDVFVSILSIESI